MNIFKRLAKCCEEAEVTVKDLPEVYEETQPDASQIFQESVKKGFTDRYTRKVMEKLLEEVAVKLYGSDAVEQTKEVIKKFGNRRFGVDERVGIRAHYPKVILSSEGYVGWEYKLSAADAMFYLIEKKALEEFDKLEVDE